ncbi:MAG: succinate dehydrogenase, cytochrome b556 subunit [Methylococcales bacterium]|jgi:succinate dehydrogenase / fumarate reductase, cytochrome b subunit|nr:succinate dehydrogenase, cytochrome b556 subunit [Methylococcales bacterium]MBT7445812.1 succinate dehydrogenase, cytochrome b556 subunit [Methylococcales bacterium]
MSKTKPRPVYLNLMQIKLPPAGLASIGHRISGLLLVLFSPVLIYLFALSLSSSQGYLEVKAIFDSFIFKLVLMLLCWSIAHHLIAGIRFLLLDMDIGMQREKVNKTAWVAMIGGLVVGFILFLRWV